MQNPTMKKARSSFDGGERAVEAKTAATVQAIADTRVIEPFGDGDQPICELPHTAV